MFASRSLLPLVFLSAGAVSLSAQSFQSYCFTPDGASEDGLYLFPVYDNFQDAFFLYGSSDERETLSKVGSDGTVEWSYQYAFAANPLAAEVIPFDEELGVVSYDGQTLGFARFSIPGLAQTDGLAFTLPANLTGHWSGDFQSAYFYTENVAMSGEVPRAGKINRDGELEWGWSVTANPGEVIAGGEIEAFSDKIEGVLSVFTFPPVTKAFEISSGGVLTRGLEWVEDGAFFARYELNEVAEDFALLAAPHTFQGFPSAFVPARVAASDGAANLLWHKEYANFLSIRVFTESSILDSDEGDALEDFDNAWLQTLFDELERLRQDDQLPFTATAVSPDAVVNSQNFATLERIHYIGYIDAESGALSQVARIDYGADIDENLTASDPFLLGVRNGDFYFATFFFDLQSQNPVIHTLIMRLDQELTVLDAAMMETANQSFPIFLPEALGSSYLFSQIETGGVRVGLVDDSLVDACDLLTPFNSLTVTPVEIGAADVDTLTVRLVSLNIEPIALSLTPESFSPVLEEFTVAVETDCCGGGGVKPGPSTSLVLNSFDPETREANVEWLSEVRKTYEIQWSDGLDGWTLLESINGTGGVINRTIDLDEIAELSDAKAVFFRLAY